MSVIGKGQLSLRKKDVVQQKSIGVGFTKIMFAHEASGGESEVNLASLSIPSGLSSNGFQQPSLNQLLELNLLFYRKNLTLISSLRGVLMDFLAYNVISNTQVRFLDFTLEAGEIITGIVDPAPKNDLLVVDGEATVTTGVLDVGETDFSVTTPFEINKHPNSQMGAVKVYRDGKLQARCVGNNLTNEGNYIEVAGNDSLSSLIRFKNAPSSQADNIIVTSHGTLVERPNGSMMAVIENNSNDIDALKSREWNQAGFYSSGTASPSTTSITNIASISSSLMHWIRVGDMVFGHGKLNMAVTSSGFFEIEVSLPIASNFDTNSDALGVIGVFNSTSDEGGIVTANDTTDRLVIRGRSSRTSEAAHNFSFTYKIK